MRKPLLLAVSAFGLVLALLYVTRETRERAATTPSTHVTDTSPPSTVVAVPTRPGVPAAPVWPTEVAEAPKRLTFSAQAPAEMVERYTTWAHSERLSDAQTQHILYAFVDARDNHREAKHVYATEADGIGPDAAREEFVAVATGRDARAELRARVAEIAGEAAAQSFDATFGEVLPFYLEDGVVIVDAAW